VTDSAEDNTVEELEKLFNDLETMTEVVVALIYKLARDRPRDQVLQKLQERAQRLRK